MKRLFRVIIIMAILVVGGCMSPHASKDLNVISALNDRLANIEAQLKTQPPAIEAQKRTRKRQPDNLNEAQKDFVNYVLEYLEGRN